MYIFQVLVGDFFLLCVNWKVFVLRVNGGCWWVGVGGGLGFEGVQYLLDIYVIFLVVG